MNILDESRIDELTPVLRAWFESMDEPSRQRYLTTIIFHRDPEVVKDLDYKPRMLVHELINRFNNDKMRTSDGHSCLYWLLYHVRERCLSPNHQDLKMARDILPFLHEVTFADPSNHPPVLEPGQDGKIHIRLFVSSPGDVKNERDLLTEKIAKEVARKYDPPIEFDIIKWEDDESAKLANLSPQEHINANLPRPSQSHIVFVIFWGRIGTELKHPQFALPYSDKPYLSGTHWELQDALHLTEYFHDSNRPPFLMVYHRQEQPKLSLNPAKILEDIEQWKNLMSFMQAFERDEEGHFKANVIKYTDPVDFETQTRKNLEDLVDRLIAPSQRGPAVDKKKPLASKRSWDIQKDGSPYPGLLAFDERHAPVYFGREHEIERMVALVKNNQMVTVIGASGSGKSSLIQAGVIPKLRNDFNIVSFHAGEDETQNPFIALYKAVVNDLRMTNPIVSQDTFLQRILTDETLFGTMLSELYPTNNKEFVIFVDQLEEVFTIVPEIYLQSFVKFLAYLAQTSNSLRVIVAIRADFVDKLQNFSKISDSMNTGATYHVTGASRLSVYRMISEPARVANIKFEDDLAVEIYEEVDDDPGSLALLAYTLRELFERSKKAYEERKDNEILILSENIYRNEIGEIKGAIKTRANEVYSDLQKRIGTDLQRVQDTAFKALVRLNEDGNATRNYGDYTKLSNDPNVKLFLDSFEKARLFVKNEKTIEVAHEAIFESWEVLSQWVVEEKDNLVLRDTILKEAKEWSAKQDPEDVWHYNHLKNVYKLLEDNIIPEDQIDDNFKKYIRLECDWWLDELEKSVNETSHYRRLNIGRVLLPKFVSQLLEDLPKLDFLHTDERLEDPRIYKGLRLSDGLPNIIWCDVAGDVFDNHLPSANEHIHVNFHGFSISKYPITRGQYQAFIEDVNGYTNSKWWAEFNEYYDHPHEIEDNFNHPMENLSWYDAMVFCNWLTDAYHHHGVLPLDEIISLPTEWEWQFAAQGRNNDKWYPWDDWQTLPEKPANIDQSKLKQTTAVGMYPLGQSSFGVEDMSGNVWEWCLNESQHWDHIELSRESRSRRGGYYGSDEKECRVVERDPLRPQLRRAAVGFRIVKCTHDINKRFKRLNQ